MSDFFVGQKIVVFGTIHTKIENIIGDIIYFYDEHGKERYLTKDEIDVNDELNPDEQKFIDDFQWQINYE